MTSNDDTPTRVRWARLRLQILGSLLASPADDGQLAARITELASRAWRHPGTDERVHFSFKTIERWYYAVRDAADPVAVLARKVPKHAGTHPLISDALGAQIHALYAEHPAWTMQLHHDNLVAVAKDKPELGPVPSYATVCRYMKHHGLGRRRKKRPARAGEASAEAAFLPRETRSFEVTHVHGLWHLDFHEGSRAILLPTGEWKKPKVLGVLDDRSRLCCHMQWYIDETAEALIHALMQALQKRGLPRALLTDNGAAMVAAETTEGLERLGIVHHTTLPYSPEQNGKQESFWGQIEGRLIPMLEGEPSLTLDLLNTASQAFIEHEYHHKLHSEIKETPLARYLRGPTVARPCPSSDTLRRAFMMEASRKQRRSDGTVTLAGVRFEVPSAYRTLINLRVRFARWDLSSVDLVDPRHGHHLATLLPLDKAKNAERIRRALAHPERAPKPAPSGIAPHLRSLMADYAATGLPPGFITRHHDEGPEHECNDHHDDPNNTDVFDPENSSA
jgi:putative transposase